MDIIRRNTDYALRIMVDLAAHAGDGALSARQLAEQGRISYELTCKLLQRLQKAGLVKSAMGPKGGWMLLKNPARITLKKIVDTIQGPLRLNQCVLGVKSCPAQPGCPVSRKLVVLQRQIDEYFAGITLAELATAKAKLKKGRKTTRRRKQK